MTTQHREVQELQKRICSWALSGALFVALLFVMIGEKAVAKGLVLGACFSILNFLLLGRSIPMMIGRSRAKANVIGFGSMMARYGVLAIPLVMAVKWVSLDLIAVIIGIFAVQIMIMLDHLVIRRLQKGFRGSTAQE
ncbi:MAG: ATP synthase subunit I [Desulfatiglandaceae bacterium]|jgi:hypothetical protein